MHVLIIGGAPLLREAVGVLAKEHGAAQVVTASTACEARRAIARKKDRPFDVILADIDLDHVSGLHLHGILAENGRLERSRFAFMTAYATPDERDYAVRKRIPIIPKRFLHDAIPRLLGA